MTSSLFNPLDPNTRLHPYEVYKRYAQHGPIQRGHASIPGYENTWYFFGFEEARQVLKAPFHKPLFSNELPNKDNDTELIPDRSLIWRHLSEWPLFQNPPIHTARRALLMDAFKESNLATLEASIRQDADKLLDNSLSKSTCEIQQEFAYPLAVGAISKILGIPCPDIPWFKSITKKLADVLDLGYVPDAYAPGMAALNELITFTEEAIDRKKTHLADDLISQLIKPLNNESNLDHNIIVSLITQVLFAGQETVADSIGIAVHTLVSHPEQLTLLQNNPALLDNAIKEILRFDCPVQFTGSRAATEDFYFGEIKIAAGEPTIIALGACNHDARRFPNPEIFDIQRDLSGPELSFGYGIHYCLGVHLARMVMRIALEKLLERLPEIWAMDKPTIWRNNNVLRGPSSLTLRLKQ